MKNMMKLFLVGAFLIGSVGAAMAITGGKTFTVSATIPAATAVNIAASSVNSQGPIVFTPVTGTALQFGTLTLDAVNGIYIPDHYFALDVGLNGPGTINTVDVSYVEGINPNAASTGHGLGYKTSATFVKVTGAVGSQTEVPVPGHTAKKKLIDLTTTESITGAQIGAAFLRIYLGIITNPTAAGEPAGAEVFSNADGAGSYTGQFTVSVTTA